MPPLPTLCTDARTTYFKRSRAAYGHLDHRPLHAVPTSNNELSVQQKDNLTILELRSCSTSSNTQPASIVRTGL